MFLWTNTFLSSSGFYVTCGAVAGWYWAEDKRKLGKSPILSSVWRYARYNLGTVLVGSFIIAVVQLIRILFNYYVKQCKQFKDNPVVKAMVCMVNCCLWCLEKVIGFINRNAYIVSATHGHGFCTSAWKGFGLIMRNLLRVAAVSSVAAAIFLFGKLFILLTTVALCYIIGQARALCSCRARGSGSCAGTRWRGGRSKCCAGDRVRGPLLLPQNPPLPRSTCHLRLPRSESRRPG